MAPEFSVGPGLHALARGGRDRARIPRFVIARIGRPPACFGGGTPRQLPEKEQRTCGHEPCVEKGCSLGRGSVGSAVARRIGRWTDDEPRERRLRRGHRENNDSGGDRLSMSADGRFVALFLQRRLQPRAGEAYGETRTVGTTSSSRSPGEYDLGVSGRLHRRAGALNSSATIQRSPTDGRHVAFRRRRRNLVHGDTHATWTFRPRPRERARPNV
jgi:hypothetical protein